MSIYRIAAYGLMLSGAAAAARTLKQRQSWEKANVHAGILLDWDDVQAVATRTGAGQANLAGVAELLGRFKSSGATHLALPELTLNRLLAKGRLSPAQGSSPNRVYLQAQDPAIADLAAAELAARLPQIKVVRSGAKTPVISFLGDLPTVAEVGLGFDPAQARLAHEVDLALVARPIGYSWVQPEMIERTLDQAAALGARVVAVQGELIPGHEFKLQHTVQAMRRNRLTFAYFSQSRHQRGDWFLAKSLAPDGLVVLAHEFQAAELLEEDWFTAARRWANLAVEGGIRLCCLRFFRVLHAADPLEALAYVQELARALLTAGLSLDQALGQVDLRPVLPVRDNLALAGAGLSAAGAAGLAAELLPLSPAWKLGVMSAGAIALGGLPFLEKPAGHQAGQDAHHHHHHDHGEHHHDHEHGEAHHHHSPETAYAPKGLALAVSAAYPAAAVLSGAQPLAALAHTALVSTAGAAALAATTVERDYVLNIETYRGYHLDWLLPLGLAAGSSLLDRTGGRRRWLPLAGVGLAVLAGLAARPGPDIPASLDREHRHAHTHHLSAFQRLVGDAGMALSGRPLRKWSFLAPLGAAVVGLLRQQGQEKAASAALLAATAGQVATLAGFRNGQRPLARTAAGRAGGWLRGALLAGLAWFISQLVSRYHRDRRK